MNVVPAPCPFCAFSETVRLGSADDGTSVYLCISCDEEFEVTSGDSQWQDL